MSYRVRERQLFRDSSNISRELVAINSHCIAFLSGRSADAVEDILNDSDMLAGDEEGLSAGERRRPIGVKGVGYET